MVKCLAQMGPLPANTDFLIQESDAQRQIVLELGQTRLHAQNHGTTAFHDYSGAID